MTIGVFTEDSVRGAAGGLETCVKGKGVGESGDGVECDICEGSRGRCTSAGEVLLVVLMVLGRGRGEGGDLRDRSEEVKGSAYKPIISDSLPCRRT